MTPRILLDLTPLVTVSSRRGIGRYVRGLVQGLTELDGQNPFIIEGLAATRNVRGLFSVTDLQKYCEEPAVEPVILAGYMRNGLITFRTSGFGRGRCDLLHLTDPKGIPWSRQVAYSLTCHDLIPLILHEMYLPKLPGWRNAYAALARLRYQRPRRILAVSNATKRDLCRELGTDPDLVDVAFHGVDHARFHAKAAADDRERVTTLLGDGPPYVLYLGAGDPRKDLRTLIQAFTLSRLRGDARLVIAGRLGASRTRELRRQSRALGVEDKLTLTGYVPEEQVPALYRSARLHVFVSRYEGFGLPVLEALACGAPTVTSPGSSLDEVAGDAALIVPVAEPDALRSALETLFYDEDTRSELRRRGLERAQRFTWRACAESTLEFWRKALG